MTPFGWAVVPEVYSSRWMSPVPSRRRGPGRPAGCRSSSVGERLRVGDGRVPVGDGDPDPGGGDQVGGGAGEVVVVEQAGDPGLLDDVRSARWRAAAS